MNSVLQTHQLGVADEECHRPVIVVLVTLVCDINIWNGTILNR